MKSFIYIIALTVFFSSCGGLSFTHRHYTPGFFKEHFAQRNKLPSLKQKLAFKEKNTGLFSHSDSSLFLNSPDTVSADNGSAWHVYGKAFSAPEYAINKSAISKKRAKPFLTARDDFKFGRYLLLMLLCLLVGAGSMFVYIFVYGHLLFSLIGFVGILAAICLAVWIFAEFIISLFHRQKNKKLHADEVQDEVSRAQNSRKRKTMKLLFTLDIVFAVLTLLIGSYGVIGLSVITQLIALLVYLLALSGKRNGNIGYLEFKKINKLFLLKTGLFLLLILIAFLLR